MALAAAMSLIRGRIHKNDQITSLRQHGFPIEVTVSSCLGVLSGSGSNAAGYSCRGTFVLDGRRYSETIPGSTLGPGTTLRLVTVKSDPGLIATVHQAESEHTSWGGFILPSVLLVILAALLGRIAVRSRRNPETVSSLSTPLLADSPRYSGSEGGV